MLGSAQHARTCTNSINESRSMKQGVKYLKVNISYLPTLRAFEGTPFTDNYDRWSTDRPIRKICPSSGVRC